MKRSMYCGQVRSEHIGKKITLTGWVHNRRDHGGVIFIDLRDREGLVQLVFHPDRAEVFKQGGALRGEFVLEIEGEVKQRPAGTENANLGTGQIEVWVEIVN